MRDSALKRFLLKTMYSTEDFVRKTNKGINKFIKKGVIIAYYRPKDDLDREYVDNLASFATNWREQKKSFMKYLERRKDLWNNLFEKCVYILDEYVSFLFFGMVEEDYFTDQIYEKSLNYRGRCVGRQRLNFIKYRLNDRALADYVDKKDVFAKNYPSEFGRIWALVPDCPKTEFLEKFKDVKKIITKPTDDFGGHGIDTVDIDGDLSEIYDNLVSLDHEVIVEEYVFQKGLLHDINPDTLNTIRVITVRTPSETKVIHAFFRTGTGGGKAVDNLHSGGYMFPVNVKTGELGRGVNMDGVSIETHPASGIKVAGITIPRWDDVKQFCIDTHVKTPYGINFIGWDVCLSGDDITFIEANLGPGFWQMYESENDWKEVFDAVKEWRKADEEAKHWHELNRKEVK